MPPESDSLFHASWQRSLRLATVRKERAVWGIVEEDGSDLPKRQRNLSFSPTLKIRVIPSTTSYSREEIQSSWYQPSDYDDIREQNAKIVKQLESQEAPTAGDCFRGLEAFTFHGMKTQHQAIDDAIALVLDEQEILWGDQMYDERQMATVYRRATQASRLAAFKAGLQDEREVNEEMEFCGMPRALETTHNSIQKEKRVSLFAKPGQRHKSNKPRKEKKAECFNGQKRHRSSRPERSLAKNVTNALQPTTKQNFEISS